jgi:hypothetical protein
VDQADVVVGELVRRVVLEHLSVQLGRLLQISVGMFFERARKDVCRLRAARGGDHERGNGDGSVRLLGCA